MMVIDPPPSMLRADFPQGRRAADARQRRADLAGDLRTGTELLRKIVVRVAGP